MPGCMTARRCAKVLAGGFQASPGRHVVRGGQSLQMALLVPFAQMNVPAQRQIGKMITTMFLDVFGVRRIDSAEAVIVYDATMHV